MEQVDQVEHLCCQVVQTFASDPSVSEMFVFGSYVEKRHDRYSDVDLHVVTHNFDATMSQLWHRLSDIGPVLVAFPLTAQIGYVAYMVLFENYPLYTKLDINIADTESHLPFSGTESLYRCVTIPMHVPSTFLPTLFEEPFNTLYGCYLGALRYMKYRKREKHFTAYKFYRAQLDHHLLEWYREISHNGLVSRLGILEYQTLDRHAESAAWKRYLYPGNEHAMDKLYLELLQKMTDEVRSSFDKHHEMATQALLHFLAQEVGEREHL